MFLRLSILFITIIFYFSDSLAQENKSYIKQTLEHNSKFIENKGQVTDQDGIPQRDIKYIYSSPGFKAVFREHSFSYEIYTMEQEASGTVISEATGELLFPVIREPNEVILKAHRIEIELLNANSDFMITSQGKSADHNNYYFSSKSENDVKGVFSYSKLTYKNVWPNIDLIFYARHEGELKYDIVIRPGGDIRDIKFKYCGQESISLSKEVLKLTTTLGELNETIPLSFLKESQRPVDVNYELADNVLSFSGRYDKSKTLIIDPKLKWATYYGGEYDEPGNAVTTNSNGDVFLVGYTGSNYNIASKYIGYQTKYIGTGDAFLVKFNKDGVRLWGTYYGSSSGSDVGTAVTIDAFENIYLGGNTTSELKNTPAVSTIGSHQYNHAGGMYDAFLVKFDSSGSRIWGTYFGGGGMSGPGTENDFCTSIATDAVGCIYMTGHTSSTSGIATKSGFQNEHSEIVLNNSYYDAYLVKFDTSGKQIWGTYYGGEGEDRSYGICIDKFNDVYITGSTASQINISTIGSYQVDYGGDIYDYKNHDAFLAKFDSSGKRLWATYYGTNTPEFSKSVSTDSSGNIYIAGYTSSTTAIATKEAYQTQNNGGNNSGYDQQYDAFLVKFNRQGKRLWGTFYGGERDDYGEVVKTDAAGNVFLAGKTASRKYISSFDTSQNKYGGGTDDIFLVKFDSTGKRDWGTYYGGERSDLLTQIANDGLGNIYISGSTLSRTRFSTSKAHQKTLADTTFSDAFLLGFKYAYPDAGILAIDSLDTSYCGNTKREIIVRVKNHSHIVRIKDLVVTCSLNGKILLTDTLKIHIRPQDTSTIIKLGTLGFQDGKNIIKVWTSYANGETDTIPQNDTLTKIVYFYTLPAAGFNTAFNCKDSLFTFTDTSKITAGSIVARLWKFGDGDSSSLQSPVHKYRIPGKYQVSLAVSSNAGCIGFFVDTITYSETPKAAFRANNICLTDSLFLIDSSINTSSWLWTFGDGKISTDRNPVHRYLSPGKFTVQLLAFNSNGCKDSASHEIFVDSSCVWPGDANADKIVNNKDILAIGVSYNDTGSTRTDTSILWAARFARDWRNSFASGVNYKHADSNGDGIINDLDTLAISKNYSKTHAKKLEAKHGKTTDPAFRVEILNDSLKLGDTLVAYILLGENALPAQDIYGVAFSLEFNREYFTRPLLDLSNAWFALGDSDFITYSNLTNVPAIALTRTNHRNKSGYGKIATLKMVLKKESGNELQFIRIGIVHNLIISADEKEVTVNVMDDSVRVIKQINTMSEQTRLAGPAINIYPNPFNDNTYLKFYLKDQADIHITLYGLEGSIIFTSSKEKLPSGEQQFLLNFGKLNLFNGMYILKVEIDGIPHYERVIKIK